MKRWLSIILMLSLFPVGALAQLPPEGYIGLYTDESHSEWCATGTVLYPVTMWLWCLPGEHGMICAEFKIVYPYNVIRSAITWNPPILIEPPDPAMGARVCLSDCQWDWYWLFSQVLYVTDPLPTYAEIVKHPDPGILDIQFTTCEPGYPVEPVRRYTNLYINYDAASPECSGTAAESRSWGAIKSLAEE